MSETTPFDIQSVAIATEFTGEKGVDFQKVYSAVKAAPDYETLDQAYRIARILIFDKGERDGVKGAKPLGSGMLSEIRKRARSLISTRKSEIPSSQYESDDTILDLKGLINGISYDQANLHN